MTATITCENCALVFDWDRPGARPRRCLNCRDRFRYPPKACEVCGQSFRSTSPTSTTCSFECSGVRRRTSASGGYRYVSRIQFINCPACSALFTWRRGKRRFCSDACKVTGKAMVQKARRARKMGRATEPFTLAEIAERDGFKCGICSRKVDMRLAWPDQNCASIDHVLPLVHGGEDVRANVQVAHWICNVRKGARGTDQLALIG